MANFNGEVFGEEIHKWTDTHLQEELARCTRGMSDILDACKAADRQLADAEVDAFDEFEARTERAGAMMDFDAIITTTRQDRDGDVLETRGARLDPKSPMCGLLSSRASR